MTNWAHDMITREVMYLTRDCGMSDAEAEVQAINDIRCRAEKGDGEAQRIMYELDKKDYDEAMYRDEYDYCPTSRMLDDEFDCGWPENYSYSPTTGMHSRKPLPVIDKGI